jgi:hypothetical protein
MDAIRNMLKRPLIVALLSALVGLVVGLIWAWGIMPVQWTDVPPDKLGSVYQEDYLRMVIDSYGVNQNSRLALMRWEALGPNAPSLLATIVSNAGSQDVSAIVAFSQLVQAPTTGATGETPTEATPTAAASGRVIGSSILTVAAIIIGILAVGGVIYFLFRLLRPMTKRSGEASPARRASDFNKQAELTDYSDMGDDQPVSQFIMTYMFGDEHFDESKSIELPNGEFLGECGVGIAKTIGVGELESPPRVAAFEVWVFDHVMNKTATKILVSNYAYDNTSFLGDLSAKELVLAQPEGRFVLETEALRMFVQIAYMEYGQGPLPDESYFEHLSLEIAVWPKVLPPQ